tara:strand:- start:5104 stop:5811 length:708 start_codon:yes stop_codon:yes gene_type:complete
MSKWSNIFGKKHSKFVSSGKEAITKALELLGSKKVAIPSYTCNRVLEGTLDANCQPHIVDCGLDLQIDLESLNNFKGDTVIVPHMFGIMSDIKPIKDLGFNIIEDCSQCLGLQDLGKYADYVIVSVGGTKWLSCGGGGILIGNDMEGGEVPSKISDRSGDIRKSLIKRTYFAQELLDAGIDLIGKDKPNAWMRGMYFTDTQKRTPYIPIHELYGNFKCPILDGYKNKLDWISIYG